VAGQKCFFVGPHLYVCFLGQSVGSPLLNAHILCNKNMPLEPCPWVLTCIQSHDSNSYSFRLVSQPEGNPRLVSRFLAEHFPLICWAESSGNCFASGTKVFSHTNSHLMATTYWWDKQELWIIVGKSFREEVINALRISMFERMERFGKCLKLSASLGQ